jgi:hypothetical protein
MASRTITLTFETEEQARRFDEAMGCRNGVVPKVASTVQAGDANLDLALAIERLAARAINARPFSGAGDPNAFSAKVEIAAAQE